MEFEQIKYEQDGPLAVVTLNRPERLNAFTDVMMSEFIRAFELADADDGVRVLIVTGAGRGYCAGQDLGGGGDSFFVEKGRDGGGLVSLRIFEMKKPVIAAINGPAVGVGLTTTLPMDVRLASDTAKMGFVFVRRGIVPDACSSWFLARLVGVSQAMEWVMTGRVFSAQEALAGGLVSRVLPPDQLLPAAKELALEIAENTSAVSVALARQMFWRMLGADHPLEAHRIESRGVASMSGSPDSHEGVASFLEKRPPRFSMKPSTDMPGFYPWWDERPFKEETSG